MEDWVLPTIRQAKEERWTFLDLGNSGLEELPDELFELSALQYLVLGGDFYDFESDAWAKSRNSGSTNSLTEIPERISGLAGLRALNINGSRVLDISPICQLSDLGALSLNQTQVIDLAPLKQLAQVQTLSLGSVPATDFSALTELSSLACLYLDGTSIVDVTPLANLSQLWFLCLAQTPVEDVSPLHALSGLTVLDLSWTAVTDLSPLSSLSNLNSLLLQSIPASDISPLKPLSRLRYLNVSYLPIDDISSLGEMLSLESLTLSGLEICDVSPLRQLHNLSSLFLQSLKLECLAREVVELPKLEELRLNLCEIKGLPKEIHGQYFNCLDAVRAHFADQDAGVVENRELKLILIGNGRVGKSSTVKRLIHDEFDPDEEPTHGIRFEPWTLEVGGQETRLNVWDFGGQDIYHGTHGLFLKSRAVFVIVWDHESETHPDGGYAEGGQFFEHEPLAYWVQYVRSVSPESPVIVVENKCDDRKPHPCPVTLDGEQSLAFSAQEGFNQSTLTAMISEACETVLQQCGGTEIGIGRVQVKQQLRQRQDDVARPLEERQRMSCDDFVSLCEQQDGKVSSPRELLRFLHNTGVVFHDERLFDNQVILDQRWAIDAIYSIYDRQRCWPILKDLKGRFGDSDQPFCQSGGHR